MKYIFFPPHFQINTNICIKLYSKIKEYVKESSNILDLYCGTGSIGIFVSENKNITGIEINKNRSYCQGVCNFLGSVWPQQKFEALAGPAL